MVEPQPIPNAAKVTGDLVLYGLCPFCKQTALLYGLTYLTIEFFDPFAEALLDADDDQPYAEEFPACHHVVVSNNHLYIFRASSVPEV